VIAFPTQLSPSQAETPRTPTPDIESIISKTPRLALRKAASQTLLRSQGIIRARIDSTSNPVPLEACPTPWHGHELQRSRSLSHGMPPEGDGDAKRTSSD